MDTYIYMYINICILYVELTGLLNRYARTLNLWCTYKFQVQKYVQTETLVMVNSHIDKHTSKMALRLG